MVLPDADGTVHGDLVARAGAGAVRPPRRHRRRRGAARRTPRRRTVVHGLPQLRRLGQRDVRQRHPGLRALPPRARGRGLPDADRDPRRRRRRSTAPATSSPPTWAPPQVLGETDGVGEGSDLAGPPRLDGQPARRRVRRQPRRGRAAARAARSTTDAIFPDGVNVEFVVRRGEHHVAMRVHERGCGRDPLLRHRRLRGRRGRPRWPTTRPAARRTASTSRAARSRIVWTEDDRVLMTGPAVLVAEGVTDL